MRRLLLALLLALAAVTARAQDEIVDVIYEINAPPTVAPSHAILSATHSDTTVTIPNDADVLTWDAASSKWKAAASAGGGGGGAPTDATYITKTADGTLSAEFALGSLGTGLLLNTTTTGVPSIFAGTSCATDTNMRSLDASGAATCGSILTDTWWNTKGDLLAATANNTAAVLAAALSNDAVLVSDSAQATGLKWQAAPLTAAQGGTGLTVPTDDNLIIGNGTVWQKKAVADCVNTAGNHLNYDASTNTFSCGSAIDSMATDTFWNAKGDIAAGTANNTGAVLGTAADGAILVTDSTGPPTGLRWQTAPLTAIQGGTDNAVSTDDNILIGNGTVWQKKAIADCQNTGANRLNYTASTNAFSCGALASIVLVDTAWAAKGDLLAATANDTASVLTAGANDTLLVADSAQTNGLKWQSHSGALDSLGSTRGMTLARGASVWAGVAVGTNGQVWKSNGTDPAWHDQVEPGSYFSIMDDFIGYNSGITVAGGDVGTWTVTNAGTGGVQVDALTLVDGNHPGVINLSTFAGTTGATTVQKYWAGFLVSGSETYETLVYLNRVSDGTDTYITRIGLCSSNLAAAACPHGIYFEHNIALSATNWYIMTAQSSTRTQTDSGIAVTSGAWHKLKWVVNAGATSVQYFVDGVSAGTITTNIPTTSTRLTGLEYQIIKSAGTTPCILAIDYVRLWKPLTR